MKTIVLTCTIWLLAITTWSQRAEPDLDKHLEHFAQQDADLNYEELYENLTQLLLHPLRLNKATADDLRVLMVLNERQINDLIAHRRAFGNFISIYELQVIPSFTPDLIRLLEPFVTVHERTTAASLLDKISHEKNNYLAFRVDRSIGPVAPIDSTAPSPLLPLRMFTRFRVSRPGEYSAGFTLEKDAGEQLHVRRGVPQFDFWSAHVQWKGTRLLNNVIVGDFTAQFGQGLVLGSGFGAGKGSETILTVRRSSPGFMPYTSATEYGFFRGAAVTLIPLKHVRLHLFGSLLPRDATLKGDSAIFITAFDASGLHRSPAELARRKTVDEINTGGCLEYAGRLWQVGVLAHRVQYRYPLLPDENAYNQFDFRGATHFNTSVYATAGWQNFSFFGEMAIGQSQRMAAIAGLVGSMSAKLDVALLARHFDPGFFSPYANALSESSSPENERGIYWGWKYIVRKQLSLSGYVDVFHFPWLRFRAYRPSSGTECLLRVNVKPSRGVDIAFQGREERKERNVSAGTRTYHPAELVKRNFFASAAVTAGKLKWKSRVQWSSLHTRATAARSTGVALVQDVSVDLGRLTLSGRYALFGTDDFDNRQYVYESDVWSAFSFPAYYGDGVRSVAMLRYNFSRRFDVWLRWSRTGYLESDAAAAGELPAGSRGDVKVQFRLRL